MDPICGNTNYWNTYKRANDELYGPVDRVGRIPASAEESSQSLGDDLYSDPLGTKHFNSHQVDPTPASAEETLRSSTESSQSPVIEKELPQDFTGTLSNDLVKAKELTVEFRYTAYTVDTICRHYYNYCFYNHEKFFTDLLYNLVMLDYGLQEYIERPETVPGGPPDVFPLDNLKVLLAKIQEYRLELIKSSRNIEQRIQHNSFLKKLLKEIGPLLKSGEKYARPTEIFDDIFPDSLLDEDASRFRSISTLADALESIDRIFIGSYETDEEESTRYETDEEESARIKDDEELFVFNVEALQELKKMWSEGTKSGGNDKIFQMLQPWCDLFVASTTKEDLVAHLQQFFSKTYKIDAQADAADDWLQRGWMFNCYIASVLSSLGFWYASFEQQAMVLHNTLLYVTKHPDCLSKECLEDAKYMKIQRYLLQKLIAADGQEGVGKKRKRDE